MVAKDLSLRVLQSLFFCAFIYSFKYYSLWLSVILSLHQGNNHCLSIREAYPMMP